MGCNPIVQVNISEKGLCFNSTSKRTVGDCLEITLLFPKRTDEWCAVTVHARVIWSKGDVDGSYKVGVEFTGMSDGSTREIAQLVLSKQIEALRVKQFEKLHTKNLSFD